MKSLSRAFIFGVFAITTLSSLEALSSNCSCEVHCVRGPNNANNIIHFYGKIKNSKGVEASPTALQRIGYDKKALNFLNYDEVRSNRYPNQVVNMYSASVTVSCNGRASISRPDSNASSSLQSSVDAAINANQFIERSCSSFLGALTPEKERILCSE